MSTATPDDDDDSDGDDTENAGPAPQNTAAPSVPPLNFTEKHRLLRLKLAPLRSLQGDLRARLGASDWPAPKADAPGRKAKTQDFFVRSNAGWKSALRPNRSPDKVRKKSQEEGETAEVLASCAEDIKALWHDDVVQEMLRRRKLRLELLPGL